MAVSTIRVFVALDPGVDRAMIDAALPETSGVQIVGIADTLESADALHHASGDVVVVACAGYSDRALITIDESLKQHPDRPVVVFLYGTADGFLRRVFEAGADDVVVLPEEPETIRFSLQKALVRKRGTVGGGATGLAPLICVLGPKGGTGKTLTATNLAVALADRGESTILLDLDLQFGDVGLALGLSPEKTLADLARTGGTIDDAKVEAYLTEHPSGLQVLLAPTRPDHASLITVQFLRDLYGTLRSMAEYVIVDTPPGFTPEVIATVDNATHLCMVATLDSLSLKNTKLGLETLDLMGFGPERVTIVLNRADSRVGVEREDVEAVLGRGPDILVPSDREISRSTNEASPIVLKERTEAARSFRALSERYAVKRERVNNGTQNGRVAEAPARRRLSFGLGRKS